MRITNRRAYHNYQIMEKLEAGISLLGSEVKAVKLGRIDLSSAFVKIKENEAFLVNANIAPSNLSPTEHNPFRSRRLLLHKKEILSLQNKAKQKKLTIIPLAIYTKDSRIKLQIALAKRLKKHEKRQKEKERDIKREIEQELKNQQY